MSQKVLIIDDAAALHQLIKAVLEEQAVQIHSAYDGLTGLALAASLKPDLVLLDVDMPTMDGFEVCKRLKGDPATRAIPIVFLTASGSTKAKVTGFELRAVDYITKPFDPTELCARVRVALRTKRLLDLLPGPTPGLGASSAASDIQQLNARLSLAHLMRSRTENPWNRRRVCDFTNTTKHAHAPAR